MSRLPEHQHRRVAYNDAYGKTTLNRWSPASTSASADQLIEGDRLDAVPFFFDAADNERGDMPARRTSALLPGFELRARPRAMPSASPTPMPISEYCLQPLPHRRARQAPRADGRCRPLTAALFLALAIAERAQRAASKFRLVGFCSIRRGALTNDARSPPLRRRALGGSGSSRNSRWFAGQKAMIAAWHGPTVMDTDRRRARPALSLPLLPLHRPRHVDARPDLPGDVMRCPLAHERHGRRWQARWSDIATALMPVRLATPSARYRRRGFNLNIGERGRYRRR